jgi:hypothetical protein
MASGPDHERIIAGVLQELLEKGDSYVTELMRASRTLMRTPEMAEALLRAEKALASCDGMLISTNANVSMIAAQAAEMKDITARLHGRAGALASVANAYGGVAAACQGPDQDEYLQLSDSALKSTAATQPPSV